MNEPLITIRETVDRPAVRRFANDDKHGGGAAGQQAVRRVSAPIHALAHASLVLVLGRKVRRS
jgi:hypothetical protein